MSTSMSYLYHILCNTLIFNMVYFRGGQVMPEGKHIINNKQKRAARKRIRDAALYTFIYHYTFAAKSKSLII